MPDLNTYTNLVQTWSIDMDLTMAKMETELADIGQQWRDAQKAGRQPPTAMLLQRCIVLQDYLQHLRKTTEEFFIECRTAVD